MTLWTDLTDIVSHWASRAPARPFVGSVAGEGGIAAGEEFVPEASYFSVRVVEMGLAEGGRFFTDFLPMGVVLTEFSVGTDRQRKPTILSNDEIASALTGVGAKPGYIEFKNVVAVRRAPVKADNLSLFVGLFRLPYQDMAKQVLQLAADLTSETGILPGAPVGIRVAEKIYDRVSGMFGLTGVKPLFAYANGNALDKSGYVLVAGSALDPAVAARLLVKDDKLLLDGERASGLDYCLLAIEHTATLLPKGEETIAPMTQLGFHRYWLEAAKFAAARNGEKAEEQMIALRSELIQTPDLTQEDRFVAIGAYETSFDKLVTRLTPKQGHRGGSRGSLAGMQAPANAGPAVTELLKGMGSSLLSNATSDDPDKIFALEASNLRAKLKQQAEPGSAIALVRALDAAALHRP
ncbi:MAG: hypothetical protein RQ966_00885 [Acetobacteraceae bacterium]|nr:hypothetical protein [Acetobacteraceae bacterium]